MYSQKDIKQFQSNVCISLQEFRRSPQNGTNWKAQPSAEIPVKTQLSSWMALQLPWQQEGGGLKILSVSLALLAVLVMLYYGGMKTEQWTEWGFYKNNETAVQNLQRKHFYQHFFKRKKKKPNMNWAIICTHSLPFLSFKGENINKLWEDLSCQNLRSLADRRVRCIFTFFFLFWNDAMFALHSLFIIAVSGKIALSL